MLGIPLTVLALKSVGQLVNIALKTVTRPLHEKCHRKNCEERNCDFVESGNICINSVCCILTWIIVCAVSKHLEPERSLITSIYSIFVTYSTVGFGDVILFENHLYVFILTLLPGLCFMSSLIDSIVAYMEKRSVASRRCFSFTKCPPEKKEARITTDVELQNIQSSENNIESTCDIEEASNGCHTNESNVVMVMASDKSKQAEVTQ